MKKPKWWNVTTFRNGQHIVTKKYSSMYCCIPTCSRSSAIVVSSHRSSQVPLWEAIFWEVEGCSTTRRNHLLPGWDRGVVGVVSKLPGVAGIYLCLYMWNTISSSPWLQESASGVTFLSLKRWWQGASLFSPSWGTPSPPSPRIPMGRLEWCWPVWIRWGWYDLPDNHPSFILLRYASVSWLKSFLPSYSRIFTKKCSRAYLYASSMWRH